MDRTMFLNRALFLLSVILTGAIAGSLVWLILFGVPFLLESNRESADWKNMLAQCAMPLVFCCVFYINYFILIPRLFSVAGNVYGCS